MEKFNILKLDNKVKPCIRIKMMSDKLTNISIIIPYLFVVFNDNNIIFILLFLINFEEIYLILL